VISQASYMYTWTIRIPNQKEKYINYKNMQIIDHSISIRKYIYIYIYIKWGVILTLTLHNNDTTPRHNRLGSMCGFHFIVPWCCIIVV
jgi:hypothetical protein